MREGEKAPSSSSREGWTGSGETGDPWVRKTRTVGGTTVNIEQYEGQVVYLYVHLPGGGKGISIDGVDEARQDELLEQVAEKASELEGLSGEDLIGAARELHAERMGENADSFSLKEGMADSWYREGALRDYIDILERSLKG